MFRPNETIIRKLSPDRNHRNALAPRQYIYMLPMHDVFIQECMPAFHSRYFLVAASMLCPIVRSLPWRVCAEACCNN
jgi:hypothetical protein